MTPASPVAAARACPGTAHGCHLRLFAPDGNRKRGPLEALREQRALPAMGYDRSSGPGWRPIRMPSGGFSGSSGNLAPANPGIPATGLQEEDGIPGRAGVGGPGLRNGMLEERDPYLFERYAG